MKSPEASQNTYYVGIHSDTPHNTYERVTITKRCYYTPHNTISKVSLYPKDVTVRPIIHEPLAVKIDLSNFWNILQYWYTSSVKEVQKTRKSLRSILTVSGSHIKRVIIPKIYYCTAYYTYQWGFFIRSFLTALWMVSKRFKTTPRPSTPGDRKTFIQLQKQRHKQRMMTTTSTTMAAAAASSIVGAHREVLYEQKAHLTRSHSRTEGTPY